MIVTLSFPANPQQEAFTLVYSFAGYSSVVITTLFNVCLELNVWPTSRFPYTSKTQKNILNAHYVQVVE